MSQFSSTIDMLPLTKASGANCSLQSADRRIHARKPAALYSLISSTGNRPLAVLVVDLCYYC